MLLPREQLRQVCRYQSKQTHEVHVLLSLALQLQDPEAGACKTDNFQPQAPQQNGLFALARKSELRVAELAAARRLKHAENFLTAARAAMASINVKSEPCATVKDEPDAAGGLRRTARTVRYMLDKCTTFTMC